MAGIYDLIRKSQADLTNICDLIELFNPLIKKYGYLLHYEDAYNDLRLEFIEIILKMDLERIHNPSDGSLILYIQKSFRNCYISRSKKYTEFRYRNCIIGEMSDGETALLQPRLSTTDAYNELDYDFFAKYLTHSEMEVILLLYYYGYGVSEISKRKHISRQAVNQLKNKAIHKLRRQLS